MTIPVFDTLKAAKALKAAGFDDSQAEAVVATVDDAVRETVVTKADLVNALRPVVTEKGLNDALRPMATKADLEPLVSKDDLAAAFKPMASKADLEPFASKTDLEPFALKTDLEPFASKTDLLVVQQQVTIRLGGLMIAGFSGLAAVIKLF